MSAEPVNISDARSAFASIIARVQTNPEPVYLSRHGKRIAAVIDADELDRLIALAEDMEDIRAAELAREEMRQTGETAVPWNEVKRDLGLM